MIFQKLLILSALILSLTGCATMQSSEAPEGTRRINLVHFPDGERVNAVYASNGRYNEDVLRKIDNIFRDRTTGEVHRIDPKLLEVMHSLVSALALPDDTQIQLTSGFRSPARQAELAQKNENFAKNSLHTTGQAADIKISGVNGKAVGAVAITLQDGGVCYYPKTTHIHVDTGNIRTWTPKN